MSWPGPFASYHLAFTPCPRRRVLGPVLAMQMRECWTAWKLRNLKLRGRKRKLHHILHTSPRISYRLLPIQYLANPIFSSPKSGLYLLSRPLLAVYTKASNYYCPRFVVSCTERPFSLRHGRSFVRFDWCTSLRDPR